MKKMFAEFEKSPFGQLTMNLRTVEEVYKAAVYGALHNETQILQILGKTGLENPNKLLDKAKYKKAIQTVNALSEKQKKVELKITNKEVLLIRKVVKTQLKVVRNVPQLARQQLIITYATLIEGYINDTIRNFFVTFPMSLKSNKTTLKDSQLIDAIFEGNPFDKLVELRIRELMYDSISGWIKFLNDKGMKVNEEKELKEMFLVRNVLIHNNKKVGMELNKAIGGRRYQLGKEINVTENDVKRYKSSIDKTVKQIETEYNKKIKKKTNTNRVATDKSKI